MELLKIDGHPCQSEGAVARGAGKRAIRARVRARIAPHCASGYVGIQQLNGFPIGEFFERRKREIAFKQHCCLMQ
jgi:hypothetical protein